MTRDSRQVCTFTLDIADILLSMGTPAGEVTALTLTVFEAFGGRKGQLEIISNVVMLTSAPSPDAAESTITRTVSGRPLDHAVLQGVRELAESARDGDLTLAEAQESLAALCSRDRRYPGWTRTLAAGLISASVPLLFGGDGLTLPATFAAGIVCDLVGSRCARRRLPPFFVVGITSAATVVAAAALAALVSLAPGQHVEATHVVVGGIVMLVVGLMFVSAFQDALDEYYLTAAARIFKVCVMTGAVVFGIVAGLYMSRRLGLELSVDPRPLPMGSPVLMTVSAACIAGFYAWYCQSRPVAVAASALVGAGVWVVFLGLYFSGVGEITASGLASVLAGFLGAMTSRRWGIPGMAVTTAGIVTLVPGLRLMNGLLQVVSGPNWSGGRDGLLTLVGALGIAFAIAAGASMGATIGRPIRERVLLARNKARRQPR